METIQDTTSTTPPPATEFLVTDAAVERIVQLNNKSGKDSQRFRVTVNGGGCSGFQYEFSLDDKAPAEDDIIIAKDGAEIVIDEVSLDYLKGSELDYTEDLAQAGFSISNPNATAKCGCGNSFSVSL